MTNPLPSFSKPNKVRSKNMREIRSSGNRTTEWKLRALLIRNAINGWRVRLPGLPGNPDFVFPTKKIAIFVDGCFWHGCKTCGRIPKTNVEYWTAKIERNKRRDRRVGLELYKRGFSAIRIRECSLRSDPAKSIQQIRDSLKALHGCSARKR